MYRSSYYRDEAEHARRLADAALQQNLEEELRRIAQQFDYLADSIATAELELRDVQVLKERNR